MTDHGTEASARRYEGIEDWPAAELAGGMIEGQLAAIAAVQAAAPMLARAIEATAERLRGGGRLIYLGAGTSGRIATQDAAELPPTFAWPPERAISLMAGGASAFTQAIEGAEDDEAAARADLDGVGIGPADVSIGVAASGRTPYAVAGLRHARGLGALTIGIHNVPRRRAGRGGRDPRPAGHRRRVRRGLDAHEGGHGAEGRAQRDLDGRDDPPGLRPQGARWSRCAPPTPSCARAPSAWSRA